MRKLILLAIIIFGLSFSLKSNTQNLDINYNSNIVLDGNGFDDPGIPVPIGLV